MKKILISALIAVFLLTACMMTPRSRRHGSRGPEAVILVPPLPPVVVFEAEPYYYHHSGYYYHYNKDRWFYSKSKRGPWTKLPKDHYPKKVRFKDKEMKKHEDQGRGREHPHDYGHDHQDGH